MVSTSALVMHLCVGTSILHQDSSNFSLMLKEYANAMPKVVGFLQFPRTGKFGRRVRIKIDLAKKVMSQLL